jgi:hypothetical protein
VSEIAQIGPTFGAASVIAGFSLVVVLLIGLLERAAAEQVR